MEVAQCAGPDPAPFLPHSVRRALGTVVVTDDAHDLGRTWGCLGCAAGPASVVTVLEPASFPTARPRCAGRIRPWAHDRGAADTSTRHTQMCRVADGERVQKVRRSLMNG